MIRFLFFAYIIFSFSACTYHKEFTNYRKKTFDGREIRMDGIYYADKPDSTNRLPFRYLLFYKDGSSYNGNDNSAIHIERTWSTLLFDSVYLPFWQRSMFSDWGSFITRGDTVIIQYFIRLSSDLSSRVVTDTYRILSDSKLQLIQKEIPIPDTVFKYFPSIEYEFHPYPQKPDSSKAWFKHRKWYKKNLSKKPEN